MNKKLLLEKYIKIAIKKALKEQEQQQQKAEKAMYLVYRFPGLKEVITTLMSPSFGRFVNTIDIIAPKPTTFKVELVNGQNFNIIYLGSEKWNIKISGKKYYIQNIGEAERASQAVADLLELSYGIKDEEPIPKGEEGPAPEQLSKDKELEADLAATNSKPPPASEDIPPVPEEEPPVT